MTASVSQLSHNAFATSRNSFARAYRDEWSGLLSRPKLAASCGVAEVTMFQPARPPLTWSTDASRRARLYGSLYVDDTVAMSPILLVCCDSAVNRVSGSSWPGGRNS